MANTFTKIDLQIVFAVQGRHSLIHASWKEELYRYITGIIQNHRHKVLRINGMPDHIHIFIGYNPNQRIPDLVREVKSSSNAFIKKKGFTKLNFQWQNGYGAFSYGRSQRDAVIKYIDLQEEHHKKKTFREEYLEFLTKFEVDFKDQYLFDFLEIKSW